MSPSQKFSSAAAMLTASSSNTIPTVQAVLPPDYIKDQHVVLGLVTSKSGTLEKKEDIVARIHEAAKHVPLDQLRLSPQCGFSSTEEGNLLTEEEQWNKLRFIKEIAESVWK